MNAAQIINEKRKILPKFLGENEVRRTELLWYSVRVEVCSALVLWQQDYAQDMLKIILREVQGILADINKFGSMGKEKESKYIDIVEEIKFYLTINEPFRCYSPEQAEEVSKESWALIGNWARYLFNDKFRLSQIESGARDPSVFFSALDPNSWFNGWNIEKRSLELSVGRDLPTSDRIIEEREVLRELFGKSGQHLAATNNPTTISYIKRKIEWEFEVLECLVDFLLSV